MTQQLRQGDVLITRVKELPAGAKVVQDGMVGRVVLAEGERHGHAHGLYDGRVRLYRDTSLTVPTVDVVRGFLGIDPDANATAQGSAPVALKHEEHAAVDIQAGTHEVRRAMEYNEERGAQWGEYHA